MGQRKKIVFSQASNVLPAADLTSKKEGKSRGKNALPANLYLLYKFSA